MVDRRTKTICTVLINHGIDPAKAPSLAEDLAESLREQPPEWIGRELRTALRNPGVLLAVIGVLLTILMVYFTFGQTVLVRDTTDQQRLPFLPSIVVIAWLVLPPVYFFIELYFRGTSNEAREMVQTYQQAAQRIWLAVAAVLVALYDLAFKVW